MSNKTKDAKELAKVQDLKSKQDTLILQLMSRIAELEDELRTMQVNMDNMEVEFEVQNDHIVKVEAHNAYLQKVETTLRGMISMLKEQLKDWQGRNDTLQEEVDALEAMVQQWQEKYEKLQTDKDREQFLNKELKKFVKELQACAANNLETIRLLEIDRNYWCQRCSDETLPLVYNTSSTFQPAQQPKQSPELTLYSFALMNQQEKCTKQRAILLWRLHLLKAKIPSPKQLNELVYDQSIAAIQQQTSHYKNLCEGLKQELQGLKQELEDATKQTKKHDNDLKDQRKFNEELMQRIAASNSSNQALTNENALLRGQLQKVHSNAIYNWQFNQTLALERGEMP